MSPSRTSHSLRPSWFAYVTGVVALVGVSAFGAVAPGCQGPDHALAVRSASLANDHVTEGQAAIDRLGQGLVRALASTGGRFVLNSPLEPEDLPERRPARMIGKARG